MEMTRTAIFVWLVLTAWAMVAQSLELGGEATTIHSLVAGMKLLQGISMTKLAELLSISAVQLAIPEKNRPSCNKRISARTQPVLRRVLDATCSIRDRVDSLEAVQRELPDDTEINTLLLVTKQIQNDTCHWLATAIHSDVSICSEENLRDVCFQWEALVTSEDAEQQLISYMRAAAITYDERNSEQKVAIAATEMMKRLLSSQC